MNYLFLRRKARITAASWMMKTTKLMPPNTMYTYKDGVMRRKIRKVVQGLQSCIYRLLAGCMMVTAKLIPPNTMYTYKDRVIWG